VPYFHGLKAFDVHTKHYFGSPTAFQEFHRSVLEYVLQKFWMATGSPEILALKDPLLTIHFPHLAQLLPEARFIVTVRDPRDAVLSLCEVLQRLNPGSNLADHLVDACTQYASIYGAILDSREKFENRLLLVDYNQLVRGKELEKLLAFGIGGLSPENIWQSSLTNVNEYAGGEWWSKLYGQPISDQSVGRYASKLSEELLSTIQNMCGAVFDRLCDWMNRQLGPVQFSQAGDAQPSCSTSAP
jgi:hypothetical protein